MYNYYTGRETITPYETESLANSMIYRTQCATRPTKGDIDKILTTCDALKMPIVLEKREIGLKYIYYFRPKKIADYNKFLTPKIKTIFCAVFGTNDINLYLDGDLIALETPGADCTVCAADILRDNDFYVSPNYKLAIGKNVKNQNVFLNLEEAPHILIAGETGSGKSMLLHQFIISLLIKHSPQDLQLYLIDPKKTEFFYYSGLRNVQTVSDIQDTLTLLKNLCAEMDTRYKTISRAGCRDIDSYNAKTIKKMPRKVVIIDELSDLMSRAATKKEAEKYIVRLAQLARAAGIHLILATQRPDRNVITGLIKDNIPTRISLSVTSGIASRIILDRTGAENLTGKGDLLYLANGARDAIRCQAGRVTEDEIKIIVYKLQHLR